MVSTSIDLSAGAGVAEAGRRSIRPMVLTARLGHEERLRRAQRWLVGDAVFITTAVAALWVTAGDSRVMQAALLATSITVIAPITFVAAVRHGQRAATTDYPSGLQRLTAVALLCGALVGLVASGWLLIDAGAAVIAGDAARPGATALLAVLYAAVPALALARIKRRFAGELHDQALHADAARDALAWRVPAAVGFATVGVATGAWWADAVGALLIAVELGRDGVRHLRVSLPGLLGCLPRRPDLAGLDPVLGVILAELAATPWVTSYQLRLREHGAQIAGEILVDIPAELPATDLITLTDRLHRADWRLTPVTVAPSRVASRAP